MSHTSSVQEVLMETEQAITRDAITAAYRSVRPHSGATPVLEKNASDCGPEPLALTFKLELLQHAGAFKTRGAFANLLMRKVPPAGVVAASGGNHGAAVAYAAMKLKVPAKIFVPTVSSPAKGQRIRDYDAQLVIEGNRYDDALAASQAWAQQSGAMSVHAFDQVETLLGQGTLGMELDQQAPHIDTLLVSVGGGGLIGGHAAWYERRVKIIGVEPYASPTLTKALAAGHPVDAEAGGLAADSLAPRRGGGPGFSVVKKCVHCVVLVDDDAIRQAQQRLWQDLRIVAEPGGAAAFSALLSGAYKPAMRERVGVIISGGNTTAVAFDG